MHSEVFVRFAEEIRFDQLTSGLPAPSDARRVLAETYFNGCSEALSSAVYARSETTFGYIVFRDDGRSIRLHVEGRTNKGDLGDLVRRSEQLGDRFIQWGKSHGHRLDAVLISLYADDYPISVGRYRTFGERLIKRFADTIFGDVVVGLFTCVLTGVLTRQWGAAVIVGSSSILCFLTWLLIEIRGESDAYEYRRF
jgi:hypothetical protein